MNEQTSFETTPEQIDTSNMLTLTERISLHVIGTLALKAHITRAMLDDITYLMKDIAAALDESLLSVNSEELAEYRKR